MVFVYHGKVESLARQVEEAKDAVNQRYREILGEERYQRLEKIADRVLTPECFFDSPEGYKSCFGSTMPPRVSSKFVVATDAHPDLHPNGRIKDSRARASFAFYVSEETFKHSGSSQFTDKIIATYIHEFNHLATFLLQRTPVYLAELYMSKDTGQVKTAEDLQKLSAKLSLDGKTPREEKRNKICMALNAYGLNDTWERSNQILDHLVLEAIGIQRPLPWRNKDRVYDAWIMNDPYLALAIPIDGDPFKGLGNEEAIRRFMEWETYYTPAMRNNLIDNFMDSLKKVRVEIMPIRELMKKNKEEREKSERQKAPKPNLRRKKRR